MFQMDMSPKVLNVEKLEKKFASLTKSRESIQGLSMWIIRHKEFYREIVNQWLDALTRDFNALTMFYVANDVIQNCGRKKAPEFRDAFASVLEKAMSFEKVKVIKNEVIRMLTIWNERKIYDDIFFRNLQDKLNAVVEPEIEVQEVAELSEAEVISSFKLESLISSLRKSQTLEEELLEKQSFLEDIEEPGMSNIDNLIVKMESHKELQKFDKFQKLVEDYLYLSDKVITAKKNALLNLKHSSIFYNAQLEDAKKVVHAYRIYGKKVKMVEKSLSEKLITFPAQSPFLSEKSPNVEFISSQELISPSISPKTTEKKLNINTPDKKCSPSSPSTEMEISDLPVVNTEKSIDIEKLKNLLFVDAKEGKNNENLLKSPEIANTVKSPYNEILNSSTVGDPKSIEETLTVDEKVKVLSDDKKALKTLPSSEEMFVKDSSSLEIEASLSASKIVEESNSKKVTKLQTLPDVESIDFLLEKAYDDHHVKSKISFKRKIDNLLKSKQLKTCKFSNEENNKDIGIVQNCQDKVSPELELSESLMQSMSFLVANETNSIESTIKFESVKINEKDIDAGITNDSEMTTPNTEKFVSSKPGQSIDKVQNDQTSDLENSKTPSSTSFPLQTLPDIPTELLKNILDKNRINMNISLNADPCLSTNNKINSFANNIEKSDKMHDSLDDGSSTNDNHSSSLKFIHSDSVIFNNGNTKNKHEEALVKETQDGINECNIKSALSTDSSSNIKSEQRTLVVKSTHFLENLQKVLDCFTKNESNIKELKCSETLNSLPCMPLENTLNVYNCIMQCQNSVDYLNNTFNPSVNSNIVLSTLANDELNNERLCSFESKGNNFQESITVSKDSSFRDKNKSALNEEFSSKDDNLEIMDMEVDSDEDTK